MYIKNSLLISLLRILFFKWGIDAIFLLHDIGYSTVINLARFAFGRNHYLCVTRDHYPCTPEKFRNGLAAWKQRHVADIATTPFKTMRIFSIIPPSWWNSCAWCAPAKYIRSDITPRRNRRSSGHAVTAGPDWKKMLSYRCVVNFSSIKLT